MSKPQEIIELEEHLGFELKEAESYIMGGGARNCYQIRNDKIIGLNLYDNDISEILFLKNFRHIKFLDLRYNKIKKIDISIIKNIKKLENLDLGYNEIIEIDFFYILKNLTILDISFNFVTDVSVLLRLIKLYSLKVIGNNIKIFPLELVKRLRVVQMYSNPIINIPEVFVNSRASKDKLTRRLKEYIIELEKDKIINERVKIIIVGNGRVGKTSFFKRLCSLDFNPTERYSHGIQIGELRKKHLPDVKTANIFANVWDFGGQDIFHATHQFFLSNSAIYILVWTKEENVIPYREREKEDLYFLKNDKWHNIEYWLDAIRRNSPKSPLLLVQTHCEKSIETLNESDLQKEFEIDNFQNFSASTDFGLNEVRSILTNKINELPMFGKEFPKTYDEVIKKIEKDKKNKKLISYQYFVDSICYQCHISKGGEDTLLDYLDKTGVVVHYPQNEKLKDFVYINPEWLTEQVYSLIDKDLDTYEDKNKGKITKAYLEKKLPNYKKLGLLELFKQFDLIFEAQENNETFWISPQYLPDTLDDNKSLKKQFNRSKIALVFRFNRFMPDNVMINFLSRYGSFADDEYWKNGISFTKNEIDCIVIKENENDLHILVDKNQEYFLLLKEVVVALSEFSKNAKTEISLDNQDFVSFLELKKDYDKGFTEIKSLQGNPLKIQDFGFLFGKEESEKVDYTKNKEKEGIEKALDLLIERKNFLMQEREKEASPNIRFSLKKQIEDIEEEIKKYRKKLHDLF